MALSSAAAAADTKRSVLELTLFKMRNTTDGMTRRTNDFLGKTAPARTQAQRLGTGRSVPIP